MSYQRDRRDGGFSLVELLVTVVIIAVLAAIAIPLYTSQKNKAATGAAQTDGRAAATEILAIANNQNVTAGAISYAAPTLTLPGSLTGTLRLSPNSSISGSMAATTLPATAQFCIKISQANSQFAFYTEAGLQKAAVATSTCSAATGIYTP